MFFPVALGGTIPRKAAEGLMHTSSVWKLKRKKKKTLFCAIMQRQHRNRKAARILRTSENIMQTTEPSLSRVQQSFRVLNSEL